MASQSDKPVMARWYFGGLASAGAACCTHPLDLLKVHLQTQTSKSLSLFGMGAQVVRNDGVLGLYAGLSASILRQLTYSTTRFGMYEVLKQQATGEDSKRQLPFLQKVGIAAVAGGSGGLVGTPADMVNVRMQNDMRTEKALRRNYKNAIDGLLRVAKEEGASRLFNGASTATSRAILMTIGQVASYDQIKQMFLESGMPDTPTTHFVSSTLAAGIATTMTQPLDVMKTKLMNAKAGEFKGVLDCAVQIGKTGPLSFYKGYVPAFVRLAPQTVITWLFLEQLRQRFGYLKA